MIVINNAGITAPKGFLASGIHCGIKFMNKDLALIYSEAPCTACGVFTQNRVQAAPLKVTQAHLRNNRAQAVIINSGNANCCTGKQGIADAIKSSQALAEKLDIKPKDVLVASTGKIGERLPLEKIVNRAKVLVDRLTKRQGTSAAQAIMTTDTYPKQLAVQIRLGKDTVTIGAMAKGAGMIHPDLATMLAFIATDAVIDKNTLKKALKKAVDNSFNLITVEGDTSTNDMVLALANGLAGNKRLAGDKLKAFQKALNFVCLTLAKMIVRDGEGASKFVEICVEKAKDITQAKAVAFKVANSPLVKTAIFGATPNWGRIAACVGMADKAVKENRLNIYLGQIKVMQNGQAAEANQQELNEIFKKDDIQIRIVLGLGKAKVKVFTCDLSETYVKINAEY